MDGYAIILAKLIRYGYNNGMAKRTAPLLPATERRLRELGDRLRLARLRRRLTAGHVAERAGMSPMTLRGIERGGPGVTIGAYAAVLQVLGLDADLELLGANDTVGRDLQDSRLRPVAERRAAPNAALAPSATTNASAPRRRAAPRQAAAPSEGISSEELARLVRPVSPHRGKL